MEVIDLDLVPFREALAFQRETAGKRLRGEVPDALILARHPDVITIGRSGSRENVLCRDGKTEVLETDRGGDVTCHCPSQIVAYPIIDLKSRGRDVHGYLRKLEEVIMVFLKRYGIGSARLDGYTGVWVDGRKIASIGIGVRRWITCHGFAVNLDSDVSCFDKIVPCGIPGIRMTSLETLLGARVERAEAKANLVSSFSEVFEPAGRESVGVPGWIRKRISSGGVAGRTREILGGKGLNTVCQSARCPNINECFARGEATFMILGAVCTRNCRFCAVSTGVPSPPDPTEPRRVAEAVREMNLRQAVITSVTRDDLEDGGAGFFAETARAVRALNPRTRIEVLVPDFEGDDGPVRKVTDSCPDVFGHNVETVPSLYFKVRPRASYARSLRVLRRAKELALAGSRFLTKSGLMLGLGEESQEVVEVMNDLRKAGCDLLTLGQYLRPADHCLPVARYLPPGEFEELSEIGEKMGFAAVSAGVFVRSSYRSGEILAGLKASAARAGEGRGRQPLSGTTAERIAGRL